MASGDTLVVFPAQGAVIASAATLASPDTRNAQAVLDFDDTTNERADWIGIMPNHYDGGGVTVTVHLTMSSATTGDVDVDVAFERQTGQNLTSDGFAAVNSTDNTTVPGTNGVEFSVSVTFTDGADMDSVVAGDLFRLRVTRDAASDTASGDMELRAVHIEET